MCVIFGAFKGERPTEEMIRLGFVKNNAGGGAAWRENGKVRYMKGMTLSEVQVINKHLPFPYVLHLRNPSTGTAIGPFATQPFVVSEDADFTLKGEAPQGVLFHNGFWSDWRNKILEAAINGGWKLPDGPWTDTRALAIMAHHVGGGALEFADEKLIWFKEHDIRIYGPVGGHRGWVQVNKILCSNRDWEPVGGTRSMGFIPASSTQVSIPETRQQDTGDVGSTKEAAGGASQNRSFRSSDAFGTAGSRGDKQERLQAGNEKTVREGVAEQRATLVLFPGEHMCEDCDKALARVDEEHKHRCWNCWDEYLKHNGRIVSGRAFLDAPGGLTQFQTPCQFCYAENAECYVRANGKAICPVCWLKHDRPTTGRYRQNDPTIREGVRAQ